MASLAEIYNPPVDLPSSLWHMFAAGVDKNPDAPAITVCHQPADHLANLISEVDTKHSKKCLSWTYRQLRHAALLISRTMLNAGATRGGTMLSLCPNGIEPILALWVSAVLQMTYVPLDAGILKPNRRDELIYYLQKLEPSAMVVQDSASFVDEALVEARVKTSAKFVLDSSCEPGWRTFKGITASDKDLTNKPDFQQDLVAEQSGDRTAAVLFTSGTSTGKPKGCPLSAKNLLHACEAKMALAELPSSYCLHTVLHRAIATVLCFLAPRYGGHLVMPSALFSPKQTLDATEQHQIEFLLCVPTQALLMSQDPSLTGRDLRSVRRVAIGGDICTTDILGKAKQCFPSATVTTGHGMTEGCGTLGTLGTDISKPLPQFHGIYTSGFPATGANVRICSPSGSILNRGEEGELQLGGPSMIDHYHDHVQPELFYTDHVGNWIKTGDKAFMDEQGYIFILGRVKDIIKRSAVSVSPAVLEAIINKHENISAVIIGVPHDILREVPVAVVKDVQPSPDRDYIKQLIVDDIGPDYALGDVVFLSELGIAEFPLNQTGKVEKLRLRDAVLRLHQSSTIVNGVH